MSELQPCPVCGGEMKIQTDGEYCRLICTKCPLEYGRFWFAKGQKQMLIKSWNRRVGEGEK